MKITRQVASSSCENEAHHATVAMLAGLAELRGNILLLREKSGELRVRSDCTVGCGSEPVISFS